MLKYVRRKSILLINDTELAMKVFLMGYLEQDDIEPALAPPGTAYHIEEWSRPSAGDLRMFMNSEVFPDYLASNIDGEFFSEMAVEIITKRTAVSQSASVKWLDIIVANHRGAAKKYYAPMFTHNIDVLDNSLTLFSGPKNDFVVRPVFSKDKIKKMHLLWLPNRRGGLYVSAQLRKDFMDHHCIGIEFSQAKVV